MIGDPFKFADRNIQTLKLMRSGLDNNVISMSYEEDVSNVFNEIKFSVKTKKAVLFLQVRQRILAVQLFNHF
jgi:hypothetical protein